MIGRIASKSSAAVFSDYLCAQGISNEIEEEDGAWIVWVHAEDQLDRARALLAEFVANPDHPKYAAERQKAQEIRAREEREEREAARKYFDRRRVFRRSVTATGGRLTLALVVLSVVGTMASVLLDPMPQQWFGFGSWQLILQGQVWRLITPIFLHAGVIHLLFNMLWLHDLGTMIEMRQGSARLALLVGVSGVLSNLAQYFVSGPGFLGMSGVVYALLGYIWVKGKLDPFSGLYVHQHIFIMMMIWLVLCMTGVVDRIMIEGGGIANASHVAGLVIGVVWGYLASQKWFSR